MKKKNLCIVLWTFVAALLSIPLYGQADAKVYVDESFNSLNAGIPAGWQNANVVSTPQVLWEFFATGYDNTPCVRFGKNYSMGASATLVTPEFEITSDAELKFMLKNKVAANVTLDVGVSADGGITMKKVLEQNVKAEDWTQMVYSLAEFKGQKVRIAFKGSTMYGYMDPFAYIDNVLVEDLPRCAQPIDLSLIKLSDTQATMTWGLAEIGSKSDNYLVTVVRASDNTALCTDSAFNTLDQTAVLKNLRPGVEYTVTLRSDCSGSYNGRSKPSAPFTFSTVTESLDLNYEQDFDGSEEKLPFGWLPYFGNAAGVAVSSQYRHGYTGNSVELTASPDKEACVVSPKFGHSPVDLQTTLFLYGTAKQEYSIGLMSDPADITTFNTVFSGTLEESNEWTEVRVNTAKMQVAENDVCVAILIPQESEDPVYIDDFYVEPIPSCLRPEGFAVSDIDSVSAKISWLSLSQKEKSVLRVMSSADTVDIDITDPSPYPLKQLTQNTEYTVMMCDVRAGNDSSEWTRPIVFNTHCGTRKEAKFVEGFETDVFKECWTRRCIAAGEGHELGDNTWSIRPNYRNGSAVMQLDKSADGTHTLLVSQPIVVGSKGQYDVSFLMMRQYMGFNYEGIALWVNNKPDTVGGTKLAFIPGGYKQTPAEKTAGWYEYDYNIPLDGVVYLIFDGINNNGQQLFIDEVKVYDAPSCRRVDKQIAFSEPELNSFNVDWTPIDRTQTQWVVKYKLMSATDTVEKKELVSGTPTYKFDNLTSSTYYEVEGNVAAYCGVGDTSVWVPFKHNCVTKCEPCTVFPYIIDFETPYFPPVCWTRAQTVAGSGVGIDNGPEAWKQNVTPMYVHSGTRSAMLNYAKQGTRTIMVSQELDLPSDDYEVLFWMYRDMTALKGSKDGIQVWVNDIPNDTTGGTKLIYIPHRIDEKPIEATTAFYRYSAPIGVSGRKYIIFEGLSFNGSASYIDDIVIREMPSCRIISNYHIGNVKAETAVVQIDEPSDSPFLVEVGPVGFKPGTGTIKAMSADGKALVEGLTPLADYEYYVRRVCGVNDSSEWSLYPVKFRTPCGAFAVTAEQPFFDGFEDGTVGMNIAECYKFDYITGRQDYKSLNQKQTYTPRTVIKPYEGQRFASKNQQLSNTWAYYPVKLNKDAKYEISGYFIQEKTETDATAFASLGYSAVPSATETVITASSIPIGNKWKLIKGYFTVPATGEYYIGFSIDQKMSVGASVDNLTLRQVECIPPTGVRVENVTEKSAIMILNSEADKWEIQVAKQPINPDFTNDLAYHNTVTDKIINLDGIFEPNTLYYYYVRSFCGDKPSDWATEAQFRTECMPQKLPVYLYFDDEQLSEIECWRTLRKTAFGYKAYPRYEGNGALTMEGVDLLTPKFDVESLAGYMVSGWAYNPGTAEAKFEVGLFNDEDEYIAIATVSVPKQRTWTEFMIPLSAVATDPKFNDFRDVKRLEFIVNQNMSFDNLSIDLIPSCPKPSDGVMSEPTHEGFKLAWKSNGDEKHWLVNVYEQGKLLFDTVVTTNPANIEGLKPITKYEVTLAALCGDAAGFDTSKITKCGNVVTECVPYTLPYKLSLSDFSPAGTGLPSCWLTADKSDASANNRWVNWSVTALRYQNNTANSWATLHSPVFDLSAPNLQSAKIVMKAKNVRAGDVQITLSADGGATFTETLGVIPQAANPNLAPITPYTFNLTPYIGKQVVVAIRAAAPQGNMSSVDIYDFEIDIVEKCNRPQTIELKSVTETEAEFVITDSVTDHNNWQLLVGDKGFDPEVDGYLYDADSRMAQVSNLDPETDYDVYVRTVCGADGRSAWRGPLTFRTACRALASVPYHESFESPMIDDVCVMFLNEGKTAVPPEMYPMKQTGNKATDGTRSLEVIASAKQPMFAILPEMAMPLRQLVLSFGYQYNSGTTDGELEFGLMTDTADINSFVSLGKCPVSITYNSVKYHFIQLGDEYEGANIAFRFASATMPSYLTYSIDNIKVYPEDGCSGVFDLRLVGATENSATFAASSESGVVQYVYGHTGMDADTCTRILTADAATFEIEGLDKEMSYHIYARSKCGDEFSYWSEPLTFSTECDVPEIAEEVQWEEKFDSYDGMYLPFPPCFTRIATSVVEGNEYPLLSKNNAVSGIRSLNLHGRNKVALPLFSVDASELLVSYSLSGEGTLNIGIVDNLADAAKIEHIGENIARVGTHDVVEYDLSYAKNNGRYVVLYTNSMEDNVYIDNLVVKAAPRFFAPRYLEVSDILDTAATFTWRGAPAAALYEYEFIEGENKVADKTSDESLTYKALEPNTKYQFRVRTKDAGDGVSDWVSVEFATRKPIASLPYSCNFENDAENANWDFIFSEEHKHRFCVGADPNGCNNTPKAMYISDDYGTTYRFDVLDSYSLRLYVTRTVYLKEGNYFCEYDWKCIGDYEKGQDYGRVFLKPADDVVQAGKNAFDSRCIRLHTDTSLHSNAEWLTEHKQFIVPETGLYNIVFSWTNDGGGGTMTPLAIDNFKLEEDNCIPPVLKIEALTDTNVVISVDNPNHFKNLEYSLMLGTDIVEADMDTVVDGKFVFRNLLPQSDYALQIRSHCDEGKVGNAVSIEFTTKCTPFEVLGDKKFFDGFEEYKVDNEPIDPCYEQFGGPALWKVMTKKSSYGLEPYNGRNYLTIGKLTNTALVHRFNLHGGKYYRISAWAKQDEATGAEVSFVRYLNDIDIVTDTIHSQQVENNWEEVLLELYVPATDIYILGVAAETKDNVHFLSIDNLSIVNIPFGRPYNLTVDEVTENTAKLSWEGNVDSYQLQLTVNGTVVKDTTVEETAVELKALRASTAYSVQVRSVKDGKYSTWSAAEFATICGAVNLPYNEDFTYVTGGIPYCWNTDASAVTAGDGWTVSDADGNPKLNINVSASKGIAEIRTNAILLTSEKSRLSFDYVVNSEIDTLRAFISADGVAFKEVFTSQGSNVNAIKATANIDDNYLGKSIVLAFRVNAQNFAEGKFVSVDNIRVNCYADKQTVEDTACIGAPYSGYGFEIGVSELNTVGKLARTRTVLGTQPGDCDYDYELELSVNDGGSSRRTEYICEDGAFSDEYFDNITEAGDHYTLVPTDKGCDSLIVVDLVILPTEVWTDSTICEGETVEFCGKTYFKSGIYSDTTENILHCDSVNLLRLTVLPRIYHTNVRVCDGKTYEWCDSILATSGYYEKRYKNYRNCDSIVTIDFEVVPTYFAFDTTICHGKSIRLGETIIRTSGSYTDTVENKLGCDSVVTLNVTVTPPDTAVVSDYACEGREYEGFGFKGIVTQDTAIIQSLVDPVDGCTEIKRIDIDFIPTYRIDSFLVVDPGETVIFGGNSYTVSGVYTYQTYSNEYGCDSIVTLHLTVGTGTQIIEAGSITIAPNPISDGIDAVVSHEFTAEECKNMTLEILNAMGQRVWLADVDCAAGDIRIEHSRFTAAGIYYICITTGTGNVYIGKLIVE